MRHEPDPSHFPKRYTASLAGNSNFAGTATRLRDLTTSNLDRAAVQSSVSGQFHLLPAGNSDPVLGFPCRTDCAGRDSRRRPSVLAHSSLRVAQAVSRQVAVCFRLFPFTSLHCTDRVALLGQIPRRVYNSRSTLCSRPISLPPRPSLLHLCPYPFV